MLVPEPMSLGGSYFGLNSRLRRLGRELPTVEVRCLYPTSWDCRAETTENVWTVAASNDGDLAKTYRRTPAGEWVKEASPPQVASWSFAEALVEDHEKMLELLKTMSRNRRLCLLRAAIHPGAGLWRTYRRRWHRDYGATDPDNFGPLIDLPRRWCVIDIDETELPPGKSYSEPASIIAWVVSDVLPVPFRGASCVWQLSSSAGLQSAGIPKCKIHLFVRARQPVGCRDYHEILKAPQFCMIDRACAVGTQIIYTARTKLRGGSDPLCCREGIYRGTNEEIDLEPEIARIKRTTATAKPTPAPVSNGPRAARDNDYEKHWLRIAYNNMGACSDGYRRPIFKMISAAIRHGERDFQRLKSDLKHLVWRRLQELGDHHKVCDVSRYLSDRELDTAIQSAWRYWSTR